MESEVGKVVDAWNDCLAKHKRYEDAVEVTDNEMILDGKREDMREAGREFAEAVTAFVDGRIKLALDKAGR